MKKIIGWIFRIVISFSTPYFALVGAAQVIPKSYLQKIGSLSEILAIVYVVLIFAISGLGFDKLIETWSKKK